MNLEEFKDSIIVTIWKELSTHNYWVSSDNINIFSKLTSGVNMIEDDIFYNLVKNKLSTYAYSYIFDYYYTQLIIPILSCNTIYAKSLKTVLLIPRKAGEGLHYYYTQKEILLMCNINDMLYPGRRIKDHLLGICESLKIEVLQ